MYLTFVEFELLKGPGAWEGRLEIYGGRISIGWSTVCVKGFGMNEAKVVCRMLGYQRYRKCQKMFLQYF